MVAPALPFPPQQMMGAPDPMMGPAMPMQPPMQPPMPMMGPGMPPPSPMMGGMPMDPMSMLPAVPSDPYAMAAGPAPDLSSVIALLSELMGPIALPRYRQKWQQPRKPTAGEMLTKAHSDRNLLLALNKRFDDNIARIEGRRFGAFDDFDEDVDKPFRDTAIADEDQQISVMVGTIPPAFESPKRKPADADESQAKEDFLTYLHEQHRKRHERAGYGDLDIEISRTLVRYGRVCTRNLCAFEHAPGAPPFYMKMIDPSIIYPTFAGERGMVYATLMYRQRVADVIGDHDYDGDIEKKLIHSPSQKKQGLAYEWDEEVEVIEYWDCAYHGLYVDGALVKGPVKHDYGEPPFVYTLTSYGAPGYTRTPQQSNNSWMDETGMIVTPLMQDLAGRGMSHFENRFDAHAQHEAMLGRMMTDYAGWKRGAIWVEQDDTVYNKGTPQFSRAEGAINILRSEHERLVPGPDSGLPSTLGPLFAASNENRGRAGLSPAEYGMTPSAQQSGYAIAGLSENGKMKIAPILIAKQSHHAAVGEQRLRFYRDWGHLLGEEGSRGEIEFPRSMPERKPDAETMWKVTPEMIDRTGTDVKCALIETPDISTISAMANAFGLLGQQGVMSRREKIRLLGLPGSRNPDQTMREVDIEGLREMPEFKLSALLKYVVEELGEPDLADFIMAQIAKGKMQQGGGGGGMPGQAPPPGPGGPPQGPPQGGPASVPGLSLPGMGQPPGTQGGRPPMQGPPNEL